jgi:hypothetical protein
VLNSEPWTQVYIDGRYRGDTPIEGLALEAGVHEVRLLNARERIARAFKVTIRPGRTLRRVLLLK